MDSSEGIPTEISVVGELQRPQLRGEILYCQKANKDIKQWHFTENKIVIIKC